MKPSLFYITALCMAASSSVAYLPMCKSTNTEPDLIESLLAIVVPGRAWNIADLRRAELSERGAKHTAYDKYYVANKVHVP